MGSNSGETTKISGNDAAECSATTVDIKIKTLDSQTFTLRVDKCVPVPELKEQIASVTGVLSEQQRLICRGKVLKDDQLLSAYHVEDGHTLHLVVRQPIDPLQERSTDQPAVDPTSSTGHNLGNRAGPGMLVGTFNISEQGDGAFPDLNRIVSAVLSSFGASRFGSGVEGIDLNQPPSERVSAAPGLSGLRNSSRLQSDLLGSAAVPLESAPPIIPDSLTTLLQYLNQLRQEFVLSAGGQNANLQNPVFPGGDRQGLEDAAHSSESRRLLTPEFLAEVMSSARQLLVEQATECLSQLAEQLNSNASVTNSVERAGIQSNAMRTGSLVQNLGASLLELGRAIMTLRMGPAPVDALVNAGPSVFVSSTGPNPIMVQPMPFQAGASFGSIPVGTVQHGSGLTGGSVGGSGFLPRNIDIRIRSGSVFARRESNGSQPQGQVAPVSSSSVNSGQQDGAGLLDATSNNRPVRTVVHAIPAASAGRGSDSSRGSIGILYPVLARVQHVTSANSGGTRASETSEDQRHGNTEQQPISESIASQPQNTEMLGGDGNSSLDDQGFSAQIRSGIEQLLRTAFPGEHVLSENVNIPASNLFASQNESAQDVGSSHEAASTVSDEGMFLSGILRQIMPIISENMGDAHNMPTEDANSAEAQANENPDQGTSSRRHRRNPQTDQSSKRPRRN